MVKTSESPEVQLKELTTEYSGSGKWWVLLGIGISTFIFGLEVHIVNLALPILVESLDTKSCFAIAMTLVQTEGFGSWTELFMLTIVAIALVCFLVVESRLSEPMLDLGMFRDLQLSLSLLLGWVVFFVVAAVNLLLPFFLELVKHYPLHEVGLLLSVLPIASALASPIAGTVSDRFGERIISLIGLLLMIGGCWAISTLDTASTALDFIVRAVPIQMGIGTFFSANSSAVMGAVPQERLGIASGLLSLSRTLGLTTGVPLVGALFSTLTLASAKLAPNIDVTQALIEALVVGVDATFRLTAAIAIASTILGIILWWVEYSETKNKSEFL